VQGIVKWFDAGKGFGFVADQTGKQHFIHHSNIEGTGYKVLEEGATVEFEIGPGKEGKTQAVSLRVVDPDVTT